MTLDSGWKKSWKILKTLINVIAFTGIWSVPVMQIILPRIYDGFMISHIYLISFAAMGWIMINNIWSMVCEGKELSEFVIGDGLIPDSNIKKKPYQKRSAMYPAVPTELLSTEPEGIILGKWKSKYVRIPLNKVFHYCILGGPGSGKTSTILLDTLLANFATKSNRFQTFAIDIKGELNEKSTYRYSDDVMVVNPSDRATCGWDPYYRLTKNSPGDLIIEAIEEIAQALIISTNSNDTFFVENARTMLTGLLIYFFNQGISFIDSVNKILESDATALIEEIIRDTLPSDLHYKFLAKYSGKKAESIEDIMTEMTTSLSIFSKSDIKFCMRDNYQKASPRSLKEGKSIFLAIPEHLLESYKPILRLCTVQTLRELERRSENEQTPIVVLIDEFARLGRLEGIFSALATLRSKKVMIILAFQSLGQCEMVYSKAETKVLVDNCRVKVICEASDTETGRMVADWSGKYREKKETQNTGRNRSKSYTYEDRPIVEPNDLITLTRDDEVIIIISGTGYLRIQKAFYFKDSVLKALADKVREYNSQFGGT